MTRLALILVASTLAVWPGVAANKPYVVVFLSDDLSWADRLKAIGTDLDARMKANDDDGLKAELVLPDPQQKKLPLCAPYPSYSCSPVPWHSPLSRRSRT